MANRDEALVQEEQGFGTPGYIFHQFYALDGKKFFVRQIILPELFYITLEKFLLNDKRQKAKKELYRIGKQFGYRISILNRFPRGNVNKVSLYSVFDFFQTAYAKNMNARLINLKEMIFEIEVDDFVVTSKGAIGYMSIGAAGGVFCYLTGNYNLESSAKKTLDGKLILLIANKKVLKEQDFEVVESNQIPPNTIDFGEYLLHNTPNLDGPEYLLSFNQLLNNGTVSYVPGVMQLNSLKERLLPLEISIIFDIEKTFDYKYVYESSYAAFYQIGITSKNKNSPCISIAQLLSGFGFGTVETIEKENKISFIFHGYPWLSKETENTNFGFINGGLIGFLNGSTGKKYGLISTTSKINNNQFNISIEIKILE